MDDFIDDSDAKIDISSEIRNIFGYVHYTLIENRIKLNLCALMFKENIYINTVSIFSVSFRFEGENWFLT